MKRLLQFVAVIAVTALVPLTVSVPSYAQSELDCEIIEPGPGSENNCEIEEEYLCEIDNENNVTITNTNSGVAASGNATVGEDGTGSDAITGTASNNTTATFSIVIENDGDGRLCRVESVTPTPPAPEPETPETPETPAVQPPQKVTPKALPVTSGSDASVVLLSAAGLVAAAGIAVAYRRLHL